MSDKVIATDINGNKAIIPRLPIDRAGMPVPGYVTRPDGSIIWVEAMGEQEHLQTP